MNTITKGNSWDYQRGTSVAPEDKLWSNNGVMTESRRQALPEAPIIKSSHCLRRWREPSSSSNPQSDITSEEHLKILLRILSTTSSRWLLYSIFVNTPCMCSWKPTASQYAHQCHVGTIGDAILFCNERGLTHISPHLLFLVIISNIGYDVHRYITTRQLPYEEW